MSTYKRLRETVSMEHVLLVFFLVTALYFFVGSYSYSERAAAFPRFTAGATIVGATLLLLRSYLPSPLRRFVTDSGGTFEETMDEADDLGSEDGVDETAGGPDEPVSDSVKDQTEPTSDTQMIRTDPPKTDSDVRYVGIREWWVHGTLFIGVLTVLYVLVGYIVGLLWASPLFVAAYLGALGRPLPITASLTVVAFLAGVAFYTFLGVGIATGAVLDFEPFLDLVLEQLSAIRPGMLVGDVSGGVFR